jgi:signal transduction histidine kinase
MPASVRDKLFRSQVTTKESGFGYGLLTCAAILQEHEADVDVQSAPDEGTMITIRFKPADRAAPNKHVSEGTSNSSAR